MKHIFFWIFCLCALKGVTQQKVDWEQLSEVKYRRMVDLRTGYMIDRARFSKEIKALDGKRIQIRGYMLPLDVKGLTYALSRFPYAACFFCGGAGRESVISIWFKPPSKRYRLDEQLTLQGILRLDDSGDGLIYVLEDAEEVD